MRTPAALPPIADGTAAGAAAAPRPVWRALALLTLAVALLHIVLLGLTPTSLGPAPLPLATKFITRTIEIAPPAAAAPAAPVAQANTAPPAPRAPPARPPRPRPVAQPPVVSEPKVAETPVPPAPPAIESVAEAPPVAAEASAAGPEAPVSGGTGGNGRSLTSGDVGPGTGTGSGGTPGATRALKVPGSMRMNFAVTGQRGPQPWSGGLGELEWLQDGDQYNARLALTILFRTVRNQTSIGRIGPDGIAPERYSEARRGEVASHLVRDRGQVVFSNNAPGVPLLPGAQDRLSVVMQIGALMAGSPAAFPPGTQMSIQTVGARDADVWVFQVEGDEQVQVPAGEFAVRKLIRKPRREFDHQIELWLAPRLGFLPVRLRQTQADGDVIDMQLRDYTPPS